MQKLPEDVSPESAAIFSVLEVHFVRKPIATNSQPFQLGEFFVHLSYQDQTAKNIPDTTKNICCLYYYLKGESVQIFEHI